MLVSSMSSTENFADRLLAVIDVKQSYVVVGLDPRPEAIPHRLRHKHQPRPGRTLQAVADAYVEFNQAIVDAVAPHVVAVKPQLAFYEQLGHAGIRAFEETVAYARSKGLLVIADAKRGDIGSTATAYAGAYLGRVAVWDAAPQVVFDVDAITINPYLGYDGIEPFVRQAATQCKGVFVLVRTSNPSAGDLQDLETVEGKVYEVVGRLVNRWGEGTEGSRGYHAVGAVVGATYPEEARALRRIMPACFFLVPGYGAQGATAEDVLSCFNPDGYGAIINAARSIIFAYQAPYWRERFPEEAFAKAAGAAAELMKQEINQALAERRLLPWTLSRPGDRMV